jgi:hypothetical protein
VLSDDCPTCGACRKPLFTSVYCPNDRCGKPPVSSDWRRILPKVPERGRTQVELRGASWGGVTWHVYELATFAGPLWIVGLSLSYDDLLRSNVAFRVNPDGSLNVIKNRHGDCHISDVPDA